MPNPPAEPVARPVAPAAAYPQLLRTGAHPARLLIFCALFTVAGFVLVVSLLAQGILALGWLAAGRPGELAAALAAGLAFETPLGLFATNVAIAATALIPVLLAVTVLRVRPGWLVSVRGRVRGRWLVASTVLAAVVLAPVVAVTLLARPQPAPPADFAWFAVIIVATSPLQAAAEELVFRGFLAQTLGALVSGPWLGVVGPALIFAALHGAQDPWLFANRFGFGVVMGILVWLTGGLEAAIAAHVLNNLAALGLAAVTATLPAARTMTAMAPAEALLGLVGYAVFAALAVLAARVLGVPVRSDLAAPRGIE